MFPKIETPQQLTEYIKKLRGEIEEHLTSNIDLEELFGTQEPNGEDVQQTIAFVRHVSKNIPVYMEKRKRLTEEYLAGRDDVPKVFKDLMLNAINLGTDFYWYVILQKTLRDSGVSEDEVEALRREYLETPKKL